MQPVDEPRTVKSDKLFILGATGGTGRALLDQALRRGQRVTAFVRSPEKLRDLPSLVHVIRGDPCSVEELTAAMPGHTAVVSALGHRGLGRSTLLRDSAQALIPAMRSSGIDRLLVVSVGLLFADAGILAALLRKTFLKNVVADSAAMEEVIEPSGVDWTVARPPILTNGPASGNYVVADGRMPPAARPIVSRADLADFLLTEVQHPAHERRYVGFGTAKSPRPEQVAATESHVHGG